MYAVKKPLHSKDITAAEIADLINVYADDLDLVYTDGPGGKQIPMSALTLPAFFDLVRAMPYRRDPSNPPIEVIARPYYIFKYAHLGRDCKKAAILCGSWLKKHAADFRLIGSSQRKDKKIHHIFPEMFFRGSWLPVDATYPQYKLFGKKTDLTKREVL